MNIRRGLLRLWVISSLLFVVLVGAFSYSGLREEFRNANTDADPKWAQYVVWPVDCAKARGTAGSDYSPPKDGLCWYKTNDFRRLYPEYKDLSDEELSEKLYAQAGRPLTHFHPWLKVLQTAGIAFGVPLAALVIGWSLL